MNDSPEEKKIVYLWIAVVILACAGLGMYSALADNNKERNDLQDQVNSLQKENEDLKSTIDTANENIDEANAIIGDAENAAWSDYDSMGDAIDSLHTVDNVSY